MRGEVTGLGGYDACLQLAPRMVLFGREVPVLDLEGLEQSSRAKDLIALELIASLKKAR